MSLKTLCEAIADSHRSGLEKPEKTCTVIGVMDGYPFKGYSLSCGHDTVDVYDHRPPYCSECGAKVVG